MFLLKDIFINEENFIDTEVEVAGWIKNSRLVLLVETMG